MEAEFDANLGRDHPNDRGMKKVDIFEDNFPADLRNQINDVLNQVD